MRSAVYYAIGIILLALALAIKVTTFVASQSQDEATAADSVKVVVEPDSAN